MGMKKGRGLEASALAFVGLVLRLGLMASRLVLIAAYRTSCQRPYAQLEPTVLLQGFLVSLHDSFR